MSDPIERMREEPGPGPVGEWASSAGASGAPERPGPARRPISSAGRNRERDQVVVLPPAREGDPSRRRSGGFRRWATAALALAAAFILYRAGEEGWLDPGSRPDGPEAAASEATATEARADADGGGEAARRFREVADSLEGAVEGYGVRRSDFERDRIGCASLAAGYREVDRLFVALSVLVRERGDRLDAGARARYRSLTEEVDRVNRHFDGSGCRTAG